MEDCSLPFFPNWLPCSESKSSTSKQCCLSYCMYSSWSTCSMRDSTAWRWKTWIQSMGASWERMEDCSLPFISAACQYRASSFYNSPRSTSSTPVRDSHMVIQQPPHRTINVSLPRTAVALSRPFLRRCTSSRVTTSSSSSSCHGSGALHHQSTV